ncbi:hypothetical protein GCM10010435_84780 [Winogradskya consettensis]|uniref:SnoaL-like domain-containing protein n=1 Tax=Winogradskya consettensis TaxID=113560 RepID=A0A919SZA4_9ACTN|nr:nuclear transport factor 2 family protein [Actinoplanes consettensis]GIM81987.1 hypothetical protein Aco04nite_79320 [Actinoplanes consettensis]
MTTSTPDIELTSDAAKQTEIYVRAFNAGDAGKLNQLYTDDAVSIWEPGRPLTGQAHRDALAEFLAQRPVMAATVRHSYVTGDTTLLVVDWTITTEEASGEKQELAGVGLDVLRLGPDGKWRYAIDNPFGEES